MNLGGIGSPNFSEGRQCYNGKEERQTGNCPPDLCKIGEYHLVVNTQSVRALWRSGVCDAKRCVIFRQAVTT